MTVNALLCAALAVAAPLFSSADDGCYGEPIDDIASGEYARSIVLPAVQGLFIDKDVSAIEKYFAEDYIQHNPFFPSGRDALNGLVEADFVYEAGMFPLRTLRPLPCSCER